MLMYIVFNSTMMMLVISCRKNLRIDIFSFCLCTILYSKMANFRLYPEMSRSKKWRCEGSVTIYFNYILKQLAIVEVALHGLKVDRYLTSPRRGRVLITKISYCILRGRIKGFNCSITTILCQVGSYRTVVG